MHEFDGVLNGDDMVAAILVTIVDHRRERGRFSRTRRPGHHYQPAMEHGELFQDCWQRCVKFLEILEGKHFAGDLAKDCRDPILLIEEVRAES